jgi:N utilization substance protein B
MGKRRRSRELALQCLYQWDFHGEAGEDPELFLAAQRDPEEVIAFARTIVAGVRGQKDELDGLIEVQSKNWKLSRMSRVDRNILRIAVFEFTSCPDIPPKVSIDEAIEIAKKFGTSDSGAFINGILDQISKRLGKKLEAQNQESDDDDPGDRDPG